MEDQNKKSTFIPRQPVSVSRSNSSLYRKEPVNLLLVIVEIVFVLLLVSTLGLFGYNYFTEKNNAEIESAAQDTVNQFDESLTKDLAALNSRISFAKNVIESHVSTSLFFERLEELQLSSVSFGALTFSGTPEEGFTVTSGGEALSYSSLAFQSQVFKDSDVFINPKFSNLSLNEVGRIGFTFTSDVAPGVVSYKSLFEEDLQADESSATSTDSVLPADGAGQATSTEQENVNEEDEVSEPSS